MYNSVEHDPTSSRAESDDRVEHGFPGGRTACDRFECSAPVRVTVGDLPDGFYVEDTGVHRL